MKMQSGNVLKKIYDYLETFGTWLIISHIKPDGDTLGSASALAQFGRDAGKTVYWGGADNFPPSYSYLPLSEYYVKLFNVSDLHINESYIAVVLDTSNIDRSVPGLDSKGPLSPRLVINIDHHGDNSRYGNLIHVDPQSSSTGEIMWRFFTENMIPITKQMAEALYTAIITDCGKFSYPNTSETTHLAAANLISCGVDPARMNQLIFQNQTLSALYLWGRAFSRATRIHKTCIFSWLRTEDFLETRADQTDTENLVSRFLFLKNIDFAVLFVQEKEKVRISLRSCGKISAREIAQIFGGGGHIPAAGCTLEMDLEMAKRQILEEISKRYAVRDSCTE